VLGIFLTVGYGYFYTVVQNDQLFLKAGLQGSLNQAKQNLEYLTVTGTLVGPVVGFIVNNSGIATTISSYFITDSSAGQSFYNSGTSSNPTLPYTISQGQSVVFNTNVLYSTGHSYTVKLLTQRGSTFVGTYPAKQLNTNDLSALIAAGIGAISMVFSSYALYNLTGSGNNWAINVAQPKPGGLLPYAVTPAFSMQVTNNDPAVGTITIDSHTEIYLYHTCGGGCGGNVPVFAFFVVNVGSVGTITSTTKGSFVPITIPYGVTQTLYFASANDLSVNSIASQQLSGSGSKVGLGEYDVFVIISGSDTESSKSILYTQNLPFAGSYLADNVAWVSETPTSCTHSSSTSFTLTVTNAWISKGNINQVSLNASGMALVTSPKQAGWANPKITGGTVITWNAGKINTGQSYSFTWSGTAPAAVGTQTVFPITISFSSGTVVSQQTAVGCYVV